MAQSSLAEDHSVVIPDGFLDPPALAPLPLKLTKEEQLSLENLVLKVENIRLQQERMKQDFLSSTRMLGQLRKEAKEYETSLNEKYGVNLAECTIEPDGSIVPKTEKPANGVPR